MFIKYIYETYFNRDHCILLDKCQKSKHYYSHLVGKEMQAYRDLLSCPKSQKEIAEPI